EEVLIISENDILAIVE
ncbi:10 kDa chaperonin, partial [Haemophilus influenzae]